MAGIYIHIPFCKQKCSYCDFHFSTSLKNKSSLVHAIIQEIESKKELLNTPIKTIYFGGGTPSLLKKDELDLIIDALYKNYTIAPTIEFTLECNPDDLSHQKLKELKTVGINRLSIGVQSFFEDDLQFFNRAHNAKEAEKSILLSQDVGFENITVDLIYGTPLLTEEKWKKNLSKIAELNVPHLSAYTLTIEPKTALYHQVKTGKIIPLADEKTVAQFKILMHQTEKIGLTQYEVSNFGKEGFYSQHNSNYWKGVEYLGIGPSAHSYIKNKRFWNVANNTKYINALSNGNTYYEEEIIDEKTAYNEYILTRLRTIWGLDTSYIKSHFNEKINIHFTKEISSYINSIYLIKNNDKITLTKEGIFIADKISSDLFLV
jgi:oxygen-independent coproporphyrinogen-3 oxidase